MFVHYACFIANLQINLIKGQDLEVGFLVLATILQIGVTNEFADLQTQIRKFANIMCYVKSIGCNSTNCHLAIRIE